MAKTQRAEPKATRMPLVWLHGEVKTPPFTHEGRQEAGMLLRLLQEGEQLTMPHAEPLPGVGPRYGAFRVRDARHNWRIMYRIDADVVIVVDVYSKKTRKIPDEVIERCRRRLKQYDATVSPGKEKTKAGITSMNAAKRKALEAAGWRFGDAADFLELSAEERQVLDARVELALAIRRQREAQDLSQKELGARLKTSQPRVAKIERAASDVSLDQLVRAFTAAGGKIIVKSEKPKPKKGRRAKANSTEAVVLEVVTSK